MNPLGKVVVGLMLLRLLAELVLSALNRAEVRRRSGAPPPGVSSVMDPETFARAGAYTLAKSRFESFSAVFDTAVLALFVFGGILPLLHALVDASDSAATGALFIVISGVLLSIPSLPFEWWEQFRIESRFGFNRSTAGLWAVDRLKGLALALILGFPLLWALLSLVRWAGQAWWIWGWAIAFGFQIVLLVLYPRLILPLFNTLSPLPDGELKDQLLALGDRTGFRAASIHVVDGSRRSAHSNAYFTGFGRFRRIVLFDTLVSQLGAEELAAVLAHEIGHYRKGHIPQRLALSAGGQLAGFAAVAWLARSSWFNPSFGFEPGELAPALLLCGLLGPLVLFWFSPVSSLLSRRHEYQADAFAREAMGGPEPLLGALRKLGEKNLANLTPHPWFSGFYYSHPTLGERERALLR
jgi:STE24 endopeptidase